MKKKFLSFVLCFIIFFSSLNINLSQALTPISLNPISASIIFSIGKVIGKGLAIYETSQTVFDLGSMFYNSLTPKEIEDLPNLDFYNGEYTINEEFERYVLDVYSKKELSPNKHLIPNVSHRINYEYKAFNDLNSAHNYANTYTYNNQKDVYMNGTIVKFSACVVSYGNTIRFYVRVNGKIYYTGTNLIEGFNLDSTEIYYQYGSYYGSYYPYFYYSYGNLTGQICRASDVVINDRCDNCPHDFIYNPNDPNYIDTFKDTDLDFFNYPPNVENFIPDNINKPSGGGSNGGGSNGDINNPVISNPPSFPNLQEFDFSGLQLEPLTNLFSNFKNKFPFSLPFDLANLLGGLKQEPIPPVFETELLGETMKLDLTQFSELANLVRMFTVLSYIIGLILLTKRFGG